jgi:hypothetical protein
VCSCFWSGRRLAFGFDPGYAERLRCALPLCDVPASFPFLAVKSVPSLNGSSSSQPSAFPPSDLDTSLLLQHRNDSTAILSLQEESSLLLGLLVSYVTHIVLQVLLPRLSLLVLQETVRHGSNIAQLQHMPKAVNFQRHISPPHARQLKGAFVQSP